MDDDLPRKNILTDLGNVVLVDAKRWQGRFRHEY